MHKTCLPGGPGLATGSCHFTETTRRGHRDSSGEQELCAPPGHFRLLPAEEPTHGPWQLEAQVGGEKQPVFRGGEKPWH